MGAIMANATGIAGVRPTADRLNAVRPSQGANTVGAARPVQAVAPTSTLGRAFSQLVQSAQVDKTEKPAPKTKEPGRSLLSTDAQFLLAETRMQEAHALFPAPSNLAPALNAYSKVQSQVKLAAGMTPDAIASYNNSYAGRPTDADTGAETSAETSTAQLQSSLPAAVA